MVVDDFNVRGIAAGKSKADTPLPVDANAVLTAPISLQRLQLVRLVPSVDQRYRADLVDVKTLASTVTQELT